jgi:carboxyl-terminal processing protease
MMGNIAYIDITSFSDNTNDGLNASLQALDLKDSTGIILDLRDNPGGSVSDMVDVASHFIKGGVIVTLVDNKVARSSQSVHPNGVSRDLPWWFW